MRKILLLIIAFLSCLSAVAQQLPNPGFEEFTGSEKGVGYDPVGWKGANVKRTVIGVTAQAEMVSPDDNGRNGKCVRIHNEKVEAAGMGAVAPSWVTLGTPWNELKGIDMGSASAGTDGGIAFKYRPDTLSVWIKRTYSSPEDANIVVYLWKGTSFSDSYKGQDGSCQEYEHYDEESDIRQNFDANACGTKTYATQIGEGSWRSREQYTTWTEVKVPIKYLNKDVPEKMNIILSSGNYPNFRASSGVNTGSVLWCDDIKFIYSSAVHEVYLNNRMMPGFSAGVKEYVHSLGKDATEVPEIALKRSGRDLAQSEYDISYGAIGEPTVITVRAEDGSSETRYSITFVRELSTESNAAGIKVGGVALPNFNGYVYSYDVVLPYGTTVCPEIEVEKANEGQIVEVEKPASLPGKVTVTVYAEDKVNKSTYTINLSVGALTDNTLTDIRVNGKPIPGFKPDQTVYVVELPVGTTGKPEIEWTTNYPEEQDITLVNNGIEGGATITVTPKGTTNSRTYRLTFRVTESTYSYLSDLRVGSKTIAGFAPEKLQYSYALPLGTVELPAIEWTKGDEYQTVTIDKGGVDGETKITVTAQSGKRSIYRIAFTAEKLTNSRLAGIKVGGVEIENFAPEKTEYEITLPVGTDKMPDIEAVKGDEWQSVQIVQGGLNGITRLFVTAQDGSMTTYTLTVNVMQANVSTLEGISVGGVPIEGFMPDVTEYNITLPRGTQSLPEITYTKHDEWQTVTVVEGGINGTTRITVKAQSGDRTTYELKFSVERSSDASLRGISVGGVAVEPFHPDTLSYRFGLPSGTTDMPEITYTKGDEWQNVIISYGGVNGTSSLRVQAEDGSVRTYTVEMFVEKSENAFLKMIYIDGEELAGYEPEKFDYGYEMPFGVQAAPEVTVAKEAGQSVSILSPALVGMVRIEVLPEAGAGNVYTVNLHYPQSSDNTLKTLTVNGDNIDGFAPDVTEYEYRLSAGEMPEVGYVKGDEAQKVLVEEMVSEEAVRVTVAAEDGTERVYTVRFVKEQSSSALLGGIEIGGEALAGFTPEKYEYTYELPAGSSSLPDIRVKKGDEGQRVDMTLPSSEGVATITVTSEDGNANSTYTVAFAAKKNGSPLLKSISVDGVPVDGFVAEKDTFVVATDGGVPTVTYEKADDSQSVAVVYRGEKSAVLTVIAEDGAEHEYTIVYDVAKRFDASLRGIKVFDGAEFVALEGFEAELLDYEYTLEWRTERVPAVSPMPGDEGQTIAIEYGGVNDETVITVTAEDGETVRVYRIMFRTEKSAVSTLSAIYVNSSLIDGFSSDVFDYEVELPAGTDVAPVVTWDLALADDMSAISEQRLTYTAAPVGEVSTIEVTAEDGSRSEYRIRFSVKPVDKPNRLELISIGGKPVGGFDGGKLEYDVELQYGTVDLPEIEVVKSYDGQTVAIVPGYADGGETHINVISDGGETATYVLRTTVSNVPDVRLSGITVGGEPIEGFRPDKYKYIVSVEDDVEVKPLTPDRIYANELNSSGKHRRFEVFDADMTDTVYYDVYLHYANDELPNLDFSEWTKAKYNNADKPVGWQVPADAAESYSYKWGIITWGTYTTGNEVKRADDGTVKLETCFDALSIAGSVPGMMTLGDLSLSLTSTGNSTSSISGGVPFRNTPDYMYMDYRPESKSGEIKNMHFQYGAYDENGGVYTADFTDGDFNNNNQWKQMRLPLIGNTVASPVKANIIVNAAHTENADDLGGTAINNAVSVMYVKGISYEYSSRLTGLTVCGVPVELSDSVYDYSVAVDAEWPGVLDVDCVGEVEDQEHDIDILALDEDGREYKITVTVTAEDGSQSVYTVNASRPASAICSLSGIEIAGVPMDGFNPEQTEYTFETEMSLMQELPELTVMKGSEYADVKIVREGGSVKITVTAEDGSTNRVYTVRFKETDRAELKNITVVGQDDFIFDPAQKDYEIALNAEEVMPMVTIEKLYDSQRISMTAGDTVRIAVRGEAGDTLSLYTVAFVQERPMSARLDDLTLNGMTFAGFVPDKYDYELVVDEELRDWGFTAGTVYDRVTETLTDDSVAFRVAGGEERTYTVRFVRELSDNVELAAITLNGSPLQGFAPSVHEYEAEAVSLYGNDFAVTAGEEGQTVSISAADGDNVREYNIDVIAADGVTALNNTVTVRRKLDGTTALADIMINGGSIAVDGNGYKSDMAFAPGQMVYNITVGSDEPKRTQPPMPEISAVAGAAGQTVTVDKGAMGGVTNIVVTAENGVDEAVYALNFTAGKSDYAALSSLAVDYKQIDGFDPEITEYVVSVDDPNIVPAVSYTAGNAFQHITVDADKAGAAITVVSESGAVTKVYRVKFNAERSSNALLGAIEIDGETISGFSPERFDYSVVLPTGTTVMPELSIKAGEEGQTVAIESGGVRGVTLITVTAQDDESRQEYRIEFSVIPSEENRLNMIYINGEELIAGAETFAPDRDFAPDVREYTVTFPIGAGEEPVVTWSAADNLQGISGERIGDDYIITVTPEVVEKVAEYRLHFVFTKSHDAELAMIMLDGEPLSADADGFIADKEFSPNETEYAVTLPVGTETVPEITWTAGDEWQTVLLDGTADVNGTVRLTVTAGDGETVKEYTLRFTRRLSDNSQLGMLMADGLPIDGFKPDSLAYTVVLPESGTSLPEVTWVAGDEWQTISATADGNVVTVRVEAENGVVTEYTVTFEVKKSDVAYLNFITVGGEPISGFDKDILEYQYLLPYGETVLPAVAWELGHEAESVDYKPASVVGDTAVIVVTSESGLVVRTYKVAFGSQLSGNAYLAGISVGGEPISVDAVGFKSDADFAPDRFAYNIILPNGTTELPEITWTGAVADYGSVVVETDGVNGTTRIVVTSQDGMAMTEYTLNFTVALSDETRLSLLTVNGKKVKGFKPDVYEYTLTYPIGTDTAALPGAAAVAYEKMHEAQTVTVDKVTDTQIIVMVTAEDGMSVGVYALKLEIEQSDNSLLSDLKVDGVSVRDFVPTQFDYTYLLYPGAVVPEVEAVKGEESQTVDITMGSVGELTYIFVNAEDGSESVYTILFDYTLVNPGEKPGKDDVCWMPMGDGTYKASSVRQNVKVFVYNVGGLIVTSADVATIDANEKINEPHDSGTLLHFERGSGVLIYVFAQDGEIIDSGKFIR